MTLDEELRRGERAQLLLEDPLLVEAFEETRQTYIREWEASPARDTAGREQLWLMLKLLEKVRGHLRTAAEGGRLARVAVLDEERRKKFGIF